MPISRRNVGRPKKTQPNESDQPATHRFFSLVISDADRAQEKDVTIDERDDEPVNRSSKKRKVFFESDDSDDDFGIVIENRQSHVAAEKGDTEDNINEAPSSSIPHKSIYLYQANIPSTSMVSPLPDIIHAINSTALKYLSDAELGRLAAQHSRQTETSGGQVSYWLEFVEMMVASHRVLLVMRGKDRMLLAMRVSRNMVIQMSLLWIQTITRRGT